MVRDKFSKSMNTMEKGEQFYFAYQQQLRHSCYRVNLIPALTNKATCSWLDWTPIQLMKTSVDIFFNYHNH